MGCEDKPAKRYLDFGFVVDQDTPPPQRVTMNIPKDTLPNKQQEVVYRGMTPKFPK